MSRNFLSIDANYNDFISLKSPVINKYILENNELLLKKVYGFMQRTENLLLVTGFVGTGKTQICKHLLNYLDKNIYSFKINCAESMCLDDVLLYLWAQFLDVASNYEIAHRLAYTSSFQERLSGCLINSNSNIVITFYNFDLINDDSKQDILNFIWTLSQNIKIKIIIASKTFDTTLIPENISYTKIILKAFSKEIFDTFLQEKNIKSSSRIIDELYKITRGYYLYTDITSIILNKKSLNVNDYLIAYTTSGLSFDKFLAKAFISMLPSESQDLLKFLAVVRHPVNSQMLDYFEKYDKHSIDLLVENKFLSYHNDFIILNDYFRKNLLLEMDEENVKEIKSILLNFYNSQLPLKPAERLLLLSRTTIRNEIKYHIGATNFVIKNEVKEQVLLNDSIFEKSDDELKVLAKEFYNKFKYNDAIKCYLELINRGSIDKDVYINLAQTYSRVGNYKYSIYYYNILIKSFNEESEVQEINKIKLEIGKIYYQIYKTADAMEILNQIIATSNDISLRIEAYTTIGNIYISLSEKSKAYESYHRAIMLLENNSSLDKYSELYFKFAILSDENDDIDSALFYYKKCIEYSADSNKYKALSYSNLGDFYLDNDNKDLAYENFKLACHFDKLNSNYYGVYYSASNIAKIIFEKSTDDCIKYLKLAQNSAFKSGDVFAIANSSLHLGDYHSNNKNYKDALKEYFYVLNLVKDKFRKDNINKILTRINDIKYTIGDDKYNELCKN